MKFVLLLSANDIAVEKIQPAYNHVSVSRYIGVDMDHYWRYVTETKNVYFYKVYHKDKLIATVHCELYDGVLHLAIVVFPEYQNMGFGTAILRAIQKGTLGIEFDKIHASIDFRNTASLKLFEKSGFHCIGKDEELFEYEYSVV